MASQPQSELIALLIEHERILAQLYDSFAHVIPEYADFWTKMQREELEHVTLIRELLKDIPGNVTLREDRVSLSALREAVAYARSVVTHAERHTPTLESAFTTALDLEESFIERKLFDIFRAGSPEMRGFLDQLEATFRTHLSSLKATRETIMPIRKS